MKVKWSESSGFPLTRVGENVFITLVDPGKSFRPSPGVRPEGIGALRGGEYVYGGAIGVGTARGRKVLKIYKSVHIKPKRSSTKGWCGRVGIFDKV